MKLSRRRLWSSVSRSSLLPSGATAAKTNASPSAASQAASSSLPSAQAAAAASTGPPLLLRPDLPGHPDHSLVEKIAAPPIR